MGLFDIFKEKEKAWKIVSRIALNAGYEAFHIENKSNRDLVNIIVANGSSTIFTAETNILSTLVDFELLIGDFEFNYFEKKKYALEQARQDLNNKTGGSIIKSTRTDSHVLYTCVIKRDVKNWSFEDLKSLVISRNSIKESFQYRFSEKL